MLSAIEHPNRRAFRADEPIERGLRVTLAERCEPSLRQCAGPPGGTENTIDVAGCAPIQICDVGFHRRLGHRRDYGESGSENGIRRKCDQFRHILSDAFGIHPFPTGCRSAHCGPRPSRFPAAAVELPRHGLVLRDRPRRKQLPQARVRPRRFHLAATWPAVNPQ
jgi:hypothetical protein